jgi:hypothetical protein
MIDKRKGLGAIPAKVKRLTPSRTPRWKGSAMSLTQSKPTRNADYRHAQSLGRQRKHAAPGTSREQAL